MIACAHVTWITVSYLSLMRRQVNDMAGIAVTAAMNRGDRKAALIAAERISDAQQRENIMRRYGFFKQLAEVRHSVLQMACSLGSCRGCSVCAVHKALLHVALTCCSPSLLLPEPRWLCIVPMLAGPWLWPGGWRPSRGGGAAGVAGFAGGGHAAAGAGPPRPGRHAEAVPHPPPWLCAAPCAGTVSACCRNLMCIQMLSEPSLETFVPWQVYDSAHFSAA